MCTSKQIEGKLSLILKMLTPSYSYLYPSSPLETQNNMKRLSLFRTELGTRANRNPETDRCASHDRTKMKSSCKVVASKQEGNKEISKDEFFVRLISTKNYVHKVVTRIEEQFCTQAVCTAHRQKTNASMFCCSSESL